MLRTRDARKRLADTHLIGQRKGMMMLVWNNDKAHTQTQIGQMEVLAGQKGELSGSDVVRAGC